MTEGMPRIVVTGIAWMGGGVGSVATTLEDLLTGARKEVLALMYSLGTGGLETLEALSTTAARGIPVIAVVNRLEQQPLETQRVLHGLVQSCPWSGLWDFSPAKSTEELHAKAVVVDRAHALIGSANISRRGLLTNYELGVALDGQPAADVARVIDRLRNEPTLAHRVYPLTGSSGLWSKVPT